MKTAIDWKALRNNAITAASNAYVLYSGLSSVFDALGDDGRVVDAITAVVMRWAPGST